MWLSLPIVVQLLSCIQLFMTPWTVARQAPLSMGFPRQEYWSELPFPSPGDLPNSGIEFTMPVFEGGFFTTELLGKPWFSASIVPAFSLCKRSSPFSSFFPPGYSASHSLFSSPIKSKGAPSCIRQKILVCYQIPNPDFHFPTNRVLAKGCYQNHSIRKF